MDSKKTGSFIAKLRKEKSLTQKQLAEKLNVTDKAISRWETGKGYPDIEILPKLSAILNVSVNEILYGDYISPEKVRMITDDNVVKAYKKQNKNKRILVLVACACVIIPLLLRIVVPMAFFIGDYFISLYGTDACVIAYDYSSIDYFGNKYVPINIEPYTCSIGECLVEEAQVEDVDYSTKLLFGDRIHAVTGCAGNEIIYLYTDYDYLESDFYCRADLYDQFQEMIDNFTAKETYAEIILSDDCITNRVPISDELLYSIDNVHIVANNVGCDINRSVGDEYIEIISYDENGILYSPKGQLLRKDNVYYWFDYNLIPEDQDNADYSHIDPYIIEGNTQELDRLFSYVFR